MPIWQLCANLLIPNCLRSNLSYSPLAALEFYVKEKSSVFLIPFINVLGLLLLAWMSVSVCTRFGKMPADVVEVLLPLANVNIVR